MAAGSAPTSMLNAIKGFAIGTSLISGGGMAAISLMGMPAILKCAESSTDVAARQFALIYRIGYVTQPPSTLLATLGFGAVAWRYYQIGNPIWRTWAVAVTAMFAVLPWTFGLMEPVSHRILRIAGEESVKDNTTEDSTQTTNLLSRWNTLNTVRSIGPVVAGSIGLWIVLS